MERKDVIKMDTIIKVKCVDQTLTLINSPVIASGGLNENKLECEFCEKWDGFSKTAVFYQDKKNVYYSLLDENDTCVIPKEATANKGTMCFGIFGSKEDVTRTSEILRYKIDEGAITEDLKPSDPTPDIYEQLLAELQAIRDLSAETLSNEQAFEKAITEQQTTFETNITKKENDYESDLNSQWSTYKSDLTNQQNTFEANITKKENAFEDSTTDKLDKYESEVEDIASSAVTKAQISKEITLTTTWTQDSTNGYYTQNVTIDGIKTTDMPTLDIKLTGNADNMKAINKEWAKILSAETYDGGIKFYAKSVTTKELTVIVKGSLSSVTVADKENIDTVLASKRSIVRGKDITSYYEDGSLWTRIANNFDDIYLGDYFKMSRAISAYEQTGAYQATGSQYVTIAEFNPEYHNGDSAKAHFNHIMLIPGQFKKGLFHFGKSRMNSSNTTVGGYVGSEMFTTTIGAAATEGSTEVTASINQQLYAEFGSHLKTYRSLLTNSINSTGYNRLGSNSGCSNNWTWNEVQARLMSEIEIYGSVVWSSSGYDTGTAKTQLSLFRLCLECINNRSSYYWLKDVASASDFAYVNGIGHASYSGASYVSLYVRPCFIVA